MCLLSRVLPVVFRDKWNNRAMIGFVALLIVLLFLRDDSPVEYVLRWTPGVLLAAVLLRSLYIGWRVCRGRRFASEAPATVRRRERIVNFMYGLFSCLLLALALWKLISQLVR